MASIRAWLYDKLAAVFRRGKTETQAAELRDAFASRAADSVGDLAGKVKGGDMSLTDWSAEMATRVKAATIAQFALGVGGTDNLTPEMQTKLGSLVGEQLGYLRDFARDIGTGDLTEEEIATRSGLYFDASTGAFGRGQMAALGVDPERVPPAHPRCKCNLRSEQDDEGIAVYWEADASACPICVDIAAGMNPWRPAA